MTCDRKEAFVEIINAMLIVALSKRNILLEVPCRLLSSGGNIFL